MESMMISRNVQIQSGCRGIEAIDGQVKYHLTAEGPSVEVVKHPTYLCRARRGGCRPWQGKNRRWVVNTNRSIVEDNPGDGSGDGLGVAGVVLLRLLVNSTRVALAVGHSPPFDIGEHPPGRCV